MKQIGSLLTAGALALSLVTLPAGAAEAAPALEETAQAAAQAALTAGGAQSIQYALWQEDHPHRLRGKLFPHGEPRPHR